MLVRKVPDISPWRGIQVMGEFHCGVIHMRYRCPMNRADQPTVWTKTDADRSLATLERRHADLRRLPSGFNEWASNRTDWLWLRMVCIADDLVRLRRRPP